MLNSYLGDLRPLYTPARFTRLIGPPRSPTAVEMALDIVRTMAGYGHWATRRVIDAVALLSESQTRSHSAGGPFRSVRATFNHLIGADLLWWYRLTGQYEYPHLSLKQLGQLWQGEPGDGQWDDIGLHSFEQQRDMLLALAVGWVAYMAGLTDEDLAADFTYSDTSGTSSHTMKRWQALMHVFNHGTHHRGQLCVLLQTLHSPSVGHGAGGTDGGRARSGSQPADAAAYAWALAGASAGPIIGLDPSSIPAGTAPPQLSLSAAVPALDLSYYLREQQRAGQ